MNLQAKYSHRDLEEARSLERMLKEILNAAQRGTSGAESLHTVRRLCDRALLAIPDEPFQEAICEMERFAADFLCAERRGRRVTPTAVFQRKLILGTLQVIDERLASLEMLRRDERAVPHAESVLQNLQP